MRRFSALTLSVTLAIVLAGCSRHKDDAVTNNAVAPAGFVPPTALNRTDFVGLIDKRFTELDLNHDSVLEASEIPLRHHDRIEAMDANHDGNVTPEERQQAMAAMRAQGRGQ